MKKIWMDEALKLAQRAADEDEVPVGAVIVRGDEIVGTGFNRREDLQDPLAHAEIQAIHAASQKLSSWRLSDCSLIVTLEPCPMCLAACQQGRLKEVFFGVTDPKGGALSLGYRLHEDLRTNHRFPVTCVETPECGAILSRFFKQKRDS